MSVRSYVTSGSIQAGRKTVVEKWEISFQITVDLLDKLNNGDEHDGTIQSTVFPAKKY